MTGLKSPELCRLVSKMAAELSEDASSQSDIFDRRAAERREGGR